MCVHPCTCLLWHVCGDQRQLWGVYSLFPPYGFQTLNSGSEAWGQVFIC